ncbi:MAG: DinB family protein [Dehalococcoidia bacterium]
MNSAYHAALVVTRTALEALDEVLVELPDAALGWVPSEGLNSVSVLVRHSLTATAFLAATGAGLAPDRDAYLNQDRTSAFATKKSTVVALRSDIQRLLDDIGPILGRGTEATLEQPATWPWPDGRTPNCGEVLVHSVGHLKEHVGQVQLMRDLWNASRPSTA